MTGLLVLVPDAAGEQIRAGGAWGLVTFRVSDPEHLGVVVAMSSGTGTRMPTLSAKSHFLKYGDVRDGGLWYRVGAELHAQWVVCRNREASLKLDGFRAGVPAGFKNPGGAAYLAITYAPDVETAFPEVSVPDLVAWYVSGEGVQPVDIEVQPEVVGLDQLATHWPVSELRKATALVVGAGSIGGAAARALGGYGVGRLLMLDPDRLLWHNLVRHISGARQVGRLKVSALRAELEELYPESEIEDCPLDVVANADQVRALLPRTDVVVCTADGVAPRRVVSHLCRRARVDAILACVLEDGGLGEVIRLRPWANRGCLTCQREALVSAGGVDPEPALDAGYGTGTRHRPMTAVGGDLHFVGQLAAKAAVATLLERDGHPDQRLAGEHAVIALRPQPGWAPPFDVHRVGEVRWLPAHPPRPGCPTCEDP